MMKDSIEPRDGIYVKGYGFLFFAKNIGKNLSKSLRSNYGQKIFDTADKSATDGLRTASMRAIQNIVEATDDLVGNKIAEKNYKGYYREYTGRLKKIHTNTTTTNYT